MFAATRGGGVALDPNAAFYIGGVAGTSSLSISSLGLSQGDLVIVSVVRNGTTACSISTAGYTTVATLSSTGGSDARTCVAYKVMGASPDASVTFSGDFAAVHAWRRMDGTTPLAATTTTATGVNPNSVDSPSISFSGGCIILSTGGLTHTGSGSITSAPSGMSNFLVVNGAPTTLSSVAIASTYSTAGSYNPAPFGAAFGGNEAWCAATLALKLA